MNAPQRTSWYGSPLVWIMAGLAVWGLYLAIGSYLYGGSMALWRAGLILGCTLAFLLVWVTVLALRRRRRKKSP